MIYLQLFIAFFEIGLFTIGGGYAMIPLISQKVVENGWISAEKLQQMIGISESTPGPFAINISTFVGYEVTGSILGGVVATLAVIAPSIIIICIIARLAKSFKDNKYVRYALWGLKAAVCGFILTVVIQTLTSSVFKGSDISNMFINLQAFDYKALIIFIISAMLLFIPGKNKKHLSPIIVILICAGLGVISILF